MNGHTGGYSNPLDNILSRVKAKRNGHGWTAHCPAHDDKNPSLSIKEGNDGQVLLYCHARCKVEDICSALGLTMQDLFPPKQEEPKHQKSKVVATYEYKDELGKLLFQVLRKEPKGFTQRRLGPDGAWVYELGDARRVLYRLPELLAADSHAPVYILEGEKDVDRARDLGLVATCNPHGSGKWKPEYSVVLRDRNIVIVPDNDEAGRKHASVVTQSLFGVAKAIKVVKLPGLAAGQDFSDWLDQGGTESELRGLVKETQRVTEQERSQAYEDQGQGHNQGQWSQQEPPPGSYEYDAGYQSETRPHLRTVCMADVVAEELDYLWEGFLVRGKFGIWEGDPGVGKTYAMLAAGAALTTGRGLPGMPEREPGNVMLLTAEDDLADTIRPRLDQLGADLTRFFAYDEPFNLENGALIDLDAELARVKPVLLVVDPIMAYISAKVNIYKSNDIRQITNPLGVLARRHKCAIIGIRHLTKGEKQRVIYRGSGGMDWVGASRLMVLVGNDPDMPGRKVIIQTKTNNGTPPKAVAFKIEGEGFYWVDAPDTTAERILAANANDEDERSAVEEAMDFLSQCLTPFPRRSKDVLREAKELSIKEPTVRAAKRALGVIATRHGTKGERGGGVWYWSLPANSGSWGDTEEEGAD